MLDPTMQGFKMTVRPSMKKYTISRPDETQRTLEVREYSRYRGSGRLNRQLLMLLQVILTDPSPIYRILEEVPSDSIGSSWTNWTCTGH